MRANLKSPGHWLLQAAVFASLLLSLTLPAAIASAAELAVIGALRTSAGGPVADGGYGMIARLYDSKGAKTPVFKAVFGKVEVKTGQFTLTLGATTEKLPDALLSSGKPLWISMQVVGDDELERAPITRVPSAWFAAAAARAKELHCEGCVGSKHIGTGAVTASKAGFTWAGSDSKGGSAKHALTADTAKNAQKAKNADSAKNADMAKMAQTAKTADSAKNAQTAKSADVANSAKTAKTAQTAKLAESAKNADTAAVAQIAFNAKSADALKCTGCIGPAHLSAATKSAFVSSAGGVVKGTLTVQGSLALGTSSITGGRFAAIDLTKTACTPKSLGQVSVNVANGKLYFCNSKAWQRLMVCSEHCPKASTVPCGKVVRNGCGDSCTTTGSFCAEGNCNKGSCTASGKTKSSAVANCKVLLDIKPTPASGEYWIDPNGGDTADAVKTWCEMSKFGGGWTLVAANSKTSKLLPTNGQGKVLTTTGLTSTPHPQKDYVIGPQMKSLTFTTAMVWAESSGKRIALTHPANTYPYVSPGANTYKVVEDSFGAGVDKKNARYFTLGCEEKDAGNNANVNQNTTGICVVTGSSGDPSTGTYFGHGTSEGSFEGYYPATGGATNVDHYSSWVR